MASPMTLIKHRKYNTYVSTNDSTFSDTASAAQFLAQNVSPISTTDTLLRTRADFYFRARVISTDPPPETWWTEATITLVAYWSTGAGGGTLNVNGTNEHYLGSQVLVPRLTPSQIVPQEYMVQWQQTEPLITETSRKGDGTAAGPTLNYYAVAYDPFNAFDGTYTGILFGWTLRVFSLWGAAS